MGGKGNQRTGKTNQKQEKVEKPPETEKLPGTSESKDSKHEDDAAEKMEDHNETLRVRLAAISKDTKDLKQEIRHEVTTLKDELKKEMKEEIATLQQEIERKLTDNIYELQTQKAMMTEAQERIAELEEWKIDAGEVMIEMLEQTRQMQEKITDLEGRSRRNNIRIFGVPEETEENSTSKYVEQLLKQSYSYLKERSSTSREHTALPRRSQARMHHPGPL